MQARIVCSILLGEKSNVSSIAALKEAICLNVDSV